VSALFHSPAGGEAQRVHGGQVLDLAVPVVADGVTVFRRTLYLRVPLDAACDRLSVAPGSALALRFEPCSVRVERSNAHWVRRWAGGFGTAQVELTYPAPLVRLDSDLYGKVGLHRVDGDAVSDDPTVSGTTGAALATPFTGVTFEARLSGEKPAARAVRKSGAIAQKQAGHKSLSAAAVGVQAAEDHATHEIDLLVEMLGGLTALHLAGTPGSPRLTLRSADATEVLWQWIAPGSHDGAVDYAATRLATDWQAALERALALASDPGPRPAVLVLPLEVASDSPCRVRVQQADASVLLERPLPGAHAALRFDGTARQDLALALAPPGGARWMSVTARYTADADAAPGTDSGAPPPTGVYLAAGSSASTVLTLPAPLRCAGAAIGWQALDGKTLLDVSVYAPSDASRPRARASIETDHASPGALYARWPAADLQAGACRVRVTVREGAGVWSGAPPGGSGMTLEPNDGTPLREVALAPALALLAPREANAPPPVVLRLGGTPLPPDPHADVPYGVLVLRLDPVPPGLAAQTSWTLEASAAQPLTLTMDAVRVAYGLD
jgi:hypothetical protein